MRENPIIYLKCLSTFNNQLINKPVMTTLTTLIYSIQGPGTFHAKFGSIWPNSYEEKIFKESAIYSSLFAYLAYNDLFINVREKPVKYV